jgi:hypothetical protein
MRIQRDADLWWAGKLDRPLVQIRLQGAGPSGPAPFLAREDFDSHQPLTATPEQIVDRWAYDLSGERYLGDAFPTRRPNFGPAVVANFLGAELHNGSGTTWATAAPVSELSRLRFEYDPDNFWLRRVREVMRLAAERFRGMVQIGLPDLAGPLDILGVFRPAEELFLDMVDQPAEVERLIWQLHELWWRYLEEFHALLRPANPGYSSWEYLFSSAPYYISQCDLAYMLGPDHYERFVKPELTATYRRMGNTFYHMDGRGQLASLDVILAMEELKGIQWVPGEGAPDLSHWPEVYRRIRGAGKLIQLIGGHYARGLEILDVLAEQLGSVKGICWIGEMDVAAAPEAEKFLGRYGVPMGGGDLC